MSASELDQAIAKLAALPTEKMRGQVGKFAKNFGADSVAALRKRLTNPSVTAEAAGLNPAFKFEWPWKWTATVIELLGAMGTPGSAELWPLLDDPNESIAQRSIIVLLRMPVLAKGDQRTAFLAELKQRLPKFYRKDVPLYPIISSMITEARKDPELLVVLADLSDLSLLGVKKQKFRLGDMCRDIQIPPAVPPKPAELPEHRKFSAKFATAIVDRKWDVVSDMLAPALQQKLTAKKLEKEFAKECAHSGWPIRHDEPQFSGFRAEELRSTSSKSQPSLPKQITDSAFRNWMWIRFWPDESSELFAFDLGIALVEDQQTLKVGYYWATAED